MEDIIKEDCMFYNSERTGKKNSCTALQERECENCKFYKHSDDPKADRAKIARQCEIYKASH